MSVSTSANVTEVYPWNPCKVPVIELRKICWFLQNGSIPKEPDAQDLYFLRGYKHNTLMSYNTGVRKFLRYANSSGKRDFVLPLSEEDIYGFCFWAGRNWDQPSNHNIASVTLTKYLFGIQAWHTNHKKKYPEKVAIKLDQLILLARVLTGGSAYQRALFDLALVAFWGMARMTEVTSEKAKGPLRLSTYHRRGVQRSQRSPNGYLRDSRSKDLRTGEGTIYPPLRN
ncbi:hypothetical protein Pst134EA_025570 [Puccinia striiformis f. sp. tritici]|uniref:Core-binding (CB) domain-containing protein n=1 Tax=Puccinia striiformis f. sp. tritici PST-78 TaxID=1165861 RepID=A0A0L0V7T5_9BASI|nr:hypothetical protein Pst134EA_025570 [Puccinia striiformis f. sp. tritici]KAH9451622.1 hypothetical protein Pst134EA_025570 [Puccinia striiformis f. sp. tritici]KNE95343.1 hypothetical protein PSTG_11328 [Puccinia striiformis f. sp. tritici PST-78]